MNDGKRDVLDGTATGYWTVDPSPNSPRIRHVGDQAGGCGGDDAIRNTQTLTLEYPSQTGTGAAMPDPAMLVPWPHHHHIIHAWHSPGGTLCALGSNGRLWFRHAGARGDLPLPWAEVLEYPPGLEPAQ